MSYIDIVREYSQKNYFEYNHEALFAQVTEAMQKNGAERAQALKEVIQKNYIAEAQKFEPMRRKAIYDSFSYEVNTKEYNRAIKIREVPAPVFLEDYVSIIEAMAKDIDETYKPEYMLGMSASDAKNLISAQLSSYSRYEEAEYRLETDGWEVAQDTAKSSGFPKLDEDQRDYAKFDEEDQGLVKETYIRKMIVEKKLSSMGFFEKIFSSKGRAMRNFVKTAERVLKDVKFPKAAEKEAEYEYSYSVAAEGEYKLYHSLIEEKMNNKQNEAEIGEKKIQESLIKNNEGNLLNEEDRKVKVDFAGEVFDEKADAKPEKIEEHQVPVHSKIIE